MALIGYAEANYYSMITKGHYFVDRTSFIAKLENLGNRNLLFARPRRFGKSLWISILHHYYDVRFKDEFEKLFGKSDIGKHRRLNGIIISCCVFNFRGLMCQRMKRRIAVFFTMLKQVLKSVWLATRTIFQMKT